MQQFEDIVVRHFQSRARDILLACEAYIEGVQFGCLVNRIDEMCYITFKNDVGSFIRCLVQFGVFWV